MKENHSAPLSKQGGGLGLFVVLVAALLVVTGALVITSSDDIRAEVEIGDFVYDLNETKGTAKIVAPAGELSGPLEIPSTVENESKIYSVTEIGNWVISGAPITKVTIPDTMKIIGEQAFAGCYLLADIIFGNGVESIGKSAFMQCQNLAEINIGNSVESIGEAAFESCISLTNVTLGENVKNIGERAFNDCGNLANIVIGEKVKNIGVQAFSGASITSVTIPESVSYIGELAFANCTKITSLNYYGSATLRADIFKDSGTTYGFDLNIGGNVTNIPDEVFMGMQVKSLVIDDESVMTIGNRAFAETPITSLTIPKSVSYIGDGAFAKTLITSVTIHESVSYIGTNAFADCTEITSINYYGSATLRNDIFSNAGTTHGFNLTVDGNVTSIPDEVFKGMQVKSLDIGESVRHIGKNSFSECIYLANLTIGENVTNIGEKAFYNCIGLTSLNYNAINATLESDVFGITEEPKKFDLTIGDNVINIPDNMFDGKPVKSLVIGESVKKIGDYAFRGSPIGQSLVIPNSVTYIGKEAFKGCESLNYLTIGEGVMKIGQNAFGDCFWLTSITYNAAGNTTIDIPIFTSASEKANNLTVVIGNNVTSIPDKLFGEGCGGKYIESLTIGENVKRIGNQAFALINVESLVIPDSVTFIGERVFGNCEKLKSVVIGEGVMEIGVEAFCYCINLTSVTYNAVGNTVTENPVFTYAGSKSNSISVVIGDKVTAIPAFLFYNNNYVRSLTIGENVKTIGAEAFNYTSIGSVVIPDSVVTIGDKAFRNCGTLSKLVIGKGVMEIGAEAFYACRRLTTIEYNAIGETKVLESTFATERVEHDLSVIFGDGVTAIPKNLFWGNNSVKTIVIGEKVTKIGINAFLDCKYVESIEFNAINVSNLGQGAFTNVGAESSGLTVTFGSKVESIPAEIFKGDTKINTVVIGENVKTIGKEAFYGCSIDSILIPDSVTAIGEKAFYGNTNLGGIIIGNGVVSFGNYVFGECPNITSVKFGTFPIDVTIGKHVFSFGTETDEITDYIFRNLKSSEGYAFTQESVLRGVFNDRIYEGDSPGSLSMMYAVITLDPNGGTCHKSMLYTDENGKLITGLPEAVREGYTFDGWFYNGEKVTSETVFSENTEIIAKWTAIPQPTPEPVPTDNGGNYTFLVILFIFLAAILAIVYIGKRTKE